MNGRANDINTNFVVGIAFRSRLEKIHDMHIYELILHIDCCRWSARNEKLNSQCLSLNDQRSPSHRRPSPAKHNERRERKSQLPLGQNEDKLESI